MRKILDLAKLDTIRVIVDDSVNFGNQKACITLMHRLRELGFNGVFDVRFKDPGPPSKSAGATAKKLQTLIKTYDPPDINSQDEITRHVDHPTLGRLNITKLPSGSILNLPPVELACSGCIDDPPGNSPTIKYNSQVYLQFSPTKWITPEFIEYRTSTSPEVVYFGLRAFGNKFIKLCFFKKTCIILNESPSHLIKLLSLLVNDGELSNLNIDVKRLISDLENPPKMVSPLNGILDLLYSFETNIDGVNSVLRYLQGINLPQDIEQRIRDCLAEMTDAITKDDKDMISTLIRTTLNLICEDLSARVYEVTERADNKMKSLVEQAKTLIIDNATSIEDLEKKELRLSCSLPEFMDFTNLSSIEKQLFDMCKRTDLKTQLIYLYKGPLALKASKTLELLFKAHIEVMLTSPANQAPVLIVPQDLETKDLEAIAMANGVNLMILDAKRDNVPSTIKPNTIIIMQTGSLDPMVFDRLLTRNDSFPSVIEGCNSIETCEYAGSAYIKAARKNERIRRFDSLDEKYKLEQDTHYKASVCLETGQPEHFPDLVKFLADSQNPNFQEYLSARKKQYHETLVDAVENAFSLLSLLKLAKPLAPDHPSSTRRLRKF